MRGCGTAVEGHDAAAAAAAAAAAGRGGAGWHVHVIESLHAAPTATAPNRILQPPPPLCNAARCLGGGKIGSKEIVSMVNVSRKTFQGKIASWENVSRGVEC